MSRSNHHQQNPRLDRLFHLSQKGLRREPWLVLEHHIRPLERPMSISTQNPYMNQAANLSQKLIWILVRGRDPHSHGPVAKLGVAVDVPEDDKAWRRPGTDMSDYFNYGFDEFTWASYCLKQNTLRQEISQSKKQMEEMQSFLGMPGGTSAGMGAMPGGAEFPPEMMQMMNQMMASGVNPQDASPEVFMQMMQGQGAGNGNMAQNYAAGQGYAQQAPNQQQMGFNYSGAGGNRGRGRRNW